MVGCVFSGGKGGGLAEGAGGGLLSAGLGARCWHVGGCLLPWALQCLPAEHLARLPGSIVAALLPLLQGDPGGLAQEETDLSEQEPLSDLDA